MTQFCLVSHWSEHKQTISHSFWTSVVWIEIAMSRLWAVCYHWGAELWAQRSEPPPPRPRAAPEGSFQLEPGHRVIRGRESEKITDSVECTQPSTLQQQITIQSSFKQTNPTRTIAFLPLCAGLEQHADTHTTRCQAKVVVSDSGVAVKYYPAQSFKGETIKKGGKKMRQSEVRRGDS